MYRNNVDQAVLFQSLGGLLDYKSQLYDILGIASKQDLIAINGIVYNANEAGNFLWAMVIEYAGGLLSPNWLAEMGSKIQGRSDEPWEQKAISDGIKFGAKLRTTSTEEFKKEVLRRRLQFRTGERSY